MSDLESSFLCFYLLIVFHQIIRNPGFSDTNCDDLNAWCPLDSTFSESFGQLLIKSIELIDVNFLKGVSGAKLVNFVMNFVENPNFIVVNCVVLDCLLS